MLQLSQVEQLSADQLERERLKRRKHLEYEKERDSFENYCQNSDLFQTNRQPSTTHSCAVRCSWSRLARSSG